MDIIIHLEEDGTGTAKLFVDEKEEGKMDLEVFAGRLTVFHTEIKPAEEGKGFAKKLLKTVVDYARENELQIVPQCAFVRGQFNKHPDEMADVWKKDI